MGDNRQSQVQHRRQQHETTNEHVSDLHRQSEDESSPLLQGHEEVEDHLKVRQLALILVLFMSIGSSWSEACIGPLKSLLIERLHLSNTRYGVLAASTQLVNTIVPIFVVWVDISGASTAALAATLFSLLGTLITASSVTNYSSLVLGRILQGLGKILLDAATTKILAKWSSASEQHTKIGMGLSISLKFSIERLAAAISQATAVPLASRSYNKISLDRPFWVAAGVAFASTLAAILYKALERRYERQIDQQSSSSFSLLQPLSLIKITGRSVEQTLNSLSLFFVVLAVSQFFQPIAVANNLVADILRWRGVDTKSAGYLAGMSQLAAIIAAPALGLFFDFYGHRLEFIAIAAFLLCASFAALGNTILSTRVAILLFSLGSALNSPPYLCSLAILLSRQQATFGCAWGVWKSLMQSYQIIMNTTLGYIQDRTPGKGYQMVLQILFLSKVLEVLFAIGYLFLDRIYMGGILTLSIPQTQGHSTNIHARMDRNANSLGCLQAYPWATWVIKVYMIVIIVMAWSFFILSFTTH